MQGFIALSRACVLVSCPPHARLPASGLVTNFLGIFPKTGITSLTTVNRFFKVKEVEVAILKAVLNCKTPRTKFHDTQYNTHTV